MCKLRCLSVAKVVIGPKAEKSPKYISEWCIWNLRRMEIVQELNAKQVRISRLDKRTWKSWGDTCICTGLWLPPSQQKCAGLKGLGRIDPSLEMVWFYGRFGVAAYLFLLLNSYFFFWNWCPTDCEFLDQSIGRACLNNSKTKLHLVTSPKNMRYTSFPSSWQEGIF